MRNLRRKIREQLGELVAVFVVVALLAGIVWGLYLLTQRPTVHNELDNATQASALETV